MLRHYFRHFYLRTEPFLISYLFKGEAFSGFFDEDLFEEIKFEGFELGPGGVVVLLFSPG